MTRVTRVCASPLLAAAFAAGPLIADDDGFGHFVAGRHDRAVELLSSELASGEDPVAAGLVLAAIHHGRGDAEAALHALLDALEKDPSSPRASGAIASLGMFVRELDPRDERVGPAIASILERHGRALDPEARSLMALALADVQLRSGRREEALATTRGAAGRVESWTLLGPYGRFDRLSFDRPYGPEHGDLEPGDDGGTLRGVSPVRIPARFAGGRVSLPPSMRRPGAAYAVTDLVLDRELALRVRLSSPLSVKLFVDGRTALVADRHEGRPPRALTARVTLGAGRHRLLVKLPSGERQAHFSLSITPAEDNADVAALRVVAPAADARLAESRSEPWTVSLDEDLPLRALDGPADALAAAWWLRARGLDEPTGSMLERVTSRWPDAPIFELLHGEFLLRAETGAAPEEDLAAARTRFERVSARDPSLTRSQLWLAKMDFGADRLDDAWRRLDSVLDARPDDLLALQLKHEIADRRGWQVEARELLDRALRSSPEDPEVLDLAVRFHRRAGALDTLPPLVEQLARRQLQQPVLAQYLTEAGRTDDAVAAWRALIDGQPTVSAFWQGLVRTLTDAGRIEEALDELGRAETYLPREIWIPMQRASLHARADGPENAAEDLDRALQLDPGRLEIREVSIALGAEDPLRPHLADARSILADAPAPKRGVDSALLADIAAVLIDDHGGQTELYQGIHAVYTRAGVEHEGELTVLQGARVESIRVHKRDGRVVDVRPGNRRPVNIPGLEPGDAIEYVWRRYIPPLSSIPGALDNQTLFIFQAPDREYVLSKYVVLHERDLPVEVCGNLDGLDVTDEIADGRRVRTYTARLMPRQRVEPHVADQLEITPHVRLGMAMTWQDLGDRIRDALVGRLRAAPPIAELAEAARSEARGPDPADLARGLYRVIQQRIRAGARGLSIDTPASAAASAGEGNRVGVALAVSRHLGLSPRLVIARPLEQNGLALDCPSPGLFGYVLVELSIGDQLVYLDLNDADYPFGSFPMRLSGSDALRVPLDDEPVTIVRLPTQDVRMVQVQTSAIRLDADGKAEGQLEITLHGQPASSTRRLLEQVTSDRLPLVYNSVAGSVYSGATVTDAKVEGLGDPESDLTIGLELEDGAWSRRTPVGFAIPMTAQPLELLSEFAPLETRRHPLMLDVQGFRRDVTRIELEPGVTVTSLPEPVALENGFGRYELVARSAGDAVVVERVVRVPAQRIEPYDYAAFREFARAIDEAERHEIRLTVASPSLSPRDAPVPAR